MDIDLTQIAALAKIVGEARPMLKALREAKLSDSQSAALNGLTDIVGDASDRLFALQTTLLELQEQNAALRAKIAGGGEWKERLAQYELIETPVGGVVYQSKGEGVPHFACPTCIESRREIHILQSNGVHSSSHTCRACSGTFRTHVAKKVEVHRSPPRGGGWMSR